MSAAAARNIATPTIITFPKSGDVAQLTQKARAAMLDFANGALFWDKRGLARWLVESYGPLTKKVDAPLLSAVAGEARATSIEDARVQELLLDTRQFLMGALRLSTDGRSGAVSAWRMIREGALTPCEDEGGKARGWMPVSHGRMRLRDRVLSLWAADFLSNDHDYATELTLCSRCFRVEFDPWSRARGTCKVHQTPSDAPALEQLASETRIRIKKPIGF